MKNKKIIQSRLKELDKNLAKVSSDTSELELILSILLKRKQSGEEIPQDLLKDINQLSKKLNGKKNK